MRDQRLKGDKQDDPDANRKELERLRELEREILKELGIKPPSTFWVFFEKYTISLSFAISLLIVSLAGAGFRYLGLYLGHLANEEAVAAAPSEQIRDVARVVAVAVECAENSRLGFYYLMIEYLPSPNWRGVTMTSATIRWPVRFCQKLQCWQRRNWSISHDRLPSAR